MKTMTADDFVETLSKRRQQLEIKLRREKDQKKKQTLLYKIEKLNIFIQEFTIVD